MSEKLQGQMWRVMVLGLHHVYAGPPSWNPQGHRPPSCLLPGHRAARVESAAEPSWASEQERDVDGLLTPHET